MSSADPSIGTSSRHAPPTGEIFILMGVIAGAHGVSGAFRLKSFTEVPRHIVTYGSLYSLDEAGHRSGRFDITLKHEIKPAIFMARAPQISTREAAVALKNTKLYIPRARLPAPDEDEFYFEDLIGLIALRPDGTPSGRVRAVHDFGAGFMLELISVPGMKGPQMITFTRECVPQIDLEGGYLTVTPEGPHE